MSDILSKVIGFKILGLEEFDGYGIVRRRNTSWALVLRAYVALVLYLYSSWLGGTNHLSASVKQFI